MSQGKCLKDWRGTDQRLAKPGGKRMLELASRRNCSVHLRVIVQSLRLIALIIKELSQFSQYAAVSGADADDVHQPLNGPLGIFQKLVYGASELRAETAQCWRQACSQGAEVYQKDTSWPAGTWPPYCSSEWSDASESSPRIPPGDSASCRSNLVATGRKWVELLKMSGSLHYSGLQQALPRL